MTLNKKFQLAVFTATTALTLTGCGVDVDKRKAEAGDLAGPRENAYYDSTGGGNLQSGQPNQIFFNNVVFLWPAPLTAAVTTAVIKASDEITTNDDKGIVQKEKIQAVDKQLEGAKADFVAALEAAALEAGVREKLEAVVAKREELSNLTPMPEDQEYAKQLDAEIDALEAELAALPTALPTEVTQAQGRCKSLFSRRTALNHELYFIGKFGEEQLAIIESRTDNFMKPDRVNIDKTDPAQVKVTMVDWPEKGATLSTETGSIKVLSIEPGRFDRIVYLVNTAPGREYYRFRLVRTRPEVEVKDGRIFYQGEVFRYQGDISAHFEGRDPERRGVAKFVNRN